MWTVGDVSGSYTLTDSDHLYPAFFNELRRMSPSWYNAAYYGTGTTNTEIQAAIDDLPATGGVVYIPAGTWTIATNLSVPSNTKIIGAGDATILTLGTGDSERKIFVNSDTSGGNDNIAFADFSIDGNRDNRTLVLGEYGIYIDNVDGLTIKNVHIINMIYEDIFLKNATNFLIDNYTSENSFTCGLDIDPSNRWGRVSNCYVENVNKVGGYFADGIRLNGSDIVCSNCIVNGSNDRGFGIGTGGWANRAKRISIENCIGYDCRDYPFFFGYAENCSIKGSYAHSKGDSAFQASSGGGGIGAQYVSGLVIDNNICEDNWFNGIAIGSDHSTGQIAERVTVSNNICLNNSGATNDQCGIWLLSATGATVQDINITGNICFDDQGTATQANGIKIAGIAGTFKRIQVNSNFCFGNKYNGINAAGGTVVGIVGNLCFNNGTRGINANNAATLTIQGNTCFDDQGTTTQDYGIYVTQSGLTPDVTGLILSGNNCFHNNQYGIYVKTLGGDTFTYSSICNNVCRDNSQETANTYSGILLEETTYCSLVGNISTGSRQEYGIESAGTSDYLTIIGNIVHGNATAGILLAGTNDKVRDNIGFATENSGTGSITAAVTSDIITHGLSYTPALADISITLGENPTNTPGAIWVDTIGGTYFTVNCENVPGASNLDFSWSVRKV